MTPHFNCTQLVNFSLPDCTSRREKQEKSGSALNPELRAQYPAGVSLLLTPANEKGWADFYGEGGRVVWLTKGVSFGCEKREICHRGCPPRLMAAPFPLVGHQQERAPSPV
ncbi:hypothetical protein CEXT_738731 [Caerostris extrusa]|uniref:Uncharacterized protein n=1 Tax=Caerostris extrusa TaxID=172846 RepID=A0AAV4PPS6_CAEEX|nr:hypothetical protein CEXT_738731 [Caerostris extrusa]